TDIAQLNASGKNIIEQYKTLLNQLKNNNQLTDDEKKKAVENITFMRDRENLVRLREITYLWNEIIDNAIQKAQLKLPFPRYIIEWIPFDDLEHVAYKTKGGFSEISTAIWKKGVIMSFDKKKQEFVRGKPITVILKNLSNGQQAEKEFLKEIETHISLGSEGFTVATCYGITRDTKTGDYILVLANYEQDLGTYIKSSYSKITWKEIYKIFYNIS
ncbi:12270_t:CDS:2, partial [Racocetra fulgida]